MAGKLLPLGHKPRGYQKPKPPITGTRLVTQGPGTIKPGGNIEKRRQLLAAKKGLAKQPQVQPGVPPPSTIKKPIALGPQAERQVSAAESAASRVNANHRAAIGVTRSVFPSLYANDGRRTFEHGMRGQTIKQWMQTPYRSGFTYGPPKF